MLTVKILHRRWGYHADISRRRGIKSRRNEIQIKEVSVIGLIGFFAPFYRLFTNRLLSDWMESASKSSLCIALSTTSMAVVYAVMLEYGFNKTEFGQRRNLDLVS